MNGRPRDSTSLPVSVNRNGVFDPDTDLLVDPEKLDVTREDEARLKDFVRSSEGADDFVRRKADGGVVAAVTG